MAIRVPDSPGAGSYGALAVLNASVSRVFCSTSCALPEPVAGLGLAERFTERTARGRAKRRSLGIIKNNAPHVGRFFLDPHHFARRGVLAERGNQLLLRERVKLFERQNGRAGVATLLALRAQLVNDLARGHEQAASVATSPSGIAGRNRPLTSSPRLDATT